MAMDIPTFATLKAGIRRFRWELGILFLFLGIAACSEVNVDPDTANITRRPKDTVIQVDSTILRDTVVMVDTVVRGNDTLYERDTLMQIRTVVRTVQIIVKDTLLISDTVTVIKQYTIVDTLRELSPERERAVKLYCLNAAGVPIESTPVELDDLTRITAELKPGVGGPASLRLKVIGRITNTLDSTKWGVSPVWFYLHVPKVELKNGVGERELYADPRSNQTAPGMAMIPRLPYNPLWYATETPANDANVFRVFRVDSVARRIYCYAKARFRKLNGRVDSLAFVFGY